MTFAVQESVKQYFTEDSVRAALDDLMPGIDGKAKSGLKRDEARQFNKAILMAAKVRHDFIDMLFELWQQTWGKALGQDFKPEPFESDQLSIEYMWEEGWIWEWAYRSPEKNNGVSVFYVRFRKEGLSLIVEARDADDSLIDLKAEANIINWRWIKTDEDSYAVSEELPLKDFFADPDSTIKNLVVEANRAKDLLSKQ